MPEDSFKNMFGVNRDDPLIMLTALTADISSMNANLKLMAENTDRRLNNLERVFDQYISLSAAVTGMQTEMRAMIANISENKTRVESIDLIKEEVKNVKDSIIPEGKTKIVNLEDDIDALRDEFKEYKNERWKLIASLAVSVCGMIGFIVKEYVLPLVLPHIH